MVLVLSSKRVWCWYALGCATIRWMRRRLRWLDLFNARALWSRLLWPVFTLLGFREVKHPAWPGPALHAGEPLLSCLCGGVPPVLHCVCEQS